MVKFAEKVAIIGLDCAQPHLIEQHIEEGYLPNLKRLRDKGFFASDCLCPLPTITPPNWASIATGAWPGTHGVTCFDNPIPNATPSSKNVVQNWSSEVLQVETIWEAADKAGKKSIVLSYPGAWPSRMENGIVMGGDGFLPGEYRHALPSGSTFMDVCQDFVVSTEFLPRSVKGSFKTAKGWENLPEDSDDLVEMSFKVPFIGSPSDPEEHTWWLLLEDTTGKGYDTVTLSPTKNYADAFTTIKANEWSKKIITKIKMKDGSEEEVFFRCKSLVLSEDGEDFRFLVGNMVPTHGGTSTHPELFKKVAYETEASLHRTAGMNFYVADVIDLETWMEMNETVSEFLGDLAVSLIENNAWDIFAMHSHPIDWFYHGLMNEMDSDDPKVKQMAWDAHRRVYQSEDRLVGRIMEAAGPETLFAIVSDHGCVPDGPIYDSYAPLMDAGLFVPKDSTVNRIPIDPHAVSDDPAAKRFNEFLLRTWGIAGLEPDVEKCKAFPQRKTYIYINLKGRDPEGIVEPEDYEKVQREIIDALLTYRDPETGERPVALALSKEDARLLGLYGDRIGDVVYALYPEFSMQHGNILPTAKWKMGSLNSVLMLCGPGIKKASRQDKPCNLIDLVPTLCYAAALPVPNGAEGAIIYSALQDSYGPFKEINRLRKGIDRMEKALISEQENSAGLRHNCA